MIAFIVGILIAIGMLGWGAHTLYQGLVSQQMDLIARAVFMLGVGLIDGFLAVIFYLIHALRDER